jgi:hypothetical protein
MFLFCSLPEKGRHTEVKLSARSENHEVMPTPWLVHIALAVNLAEGREERRNGVFQDRWVKAMRLEAISKLDAANRYLDKVFLRGRFFGATAKPEHGTSNDWRILPLFVQSLESSGGELTSGRWRGWLHGRRPSRIRPSRTQGCPVHAAGVLVVTQIHPTIPRGRAPLGAVLRSRCT